MTPEQIKQLRVDLQRTQKGLAKVLGTTPITVGRWERAESVPMPIYKIHLDKLRAYMDTRKQEVV